MLLSRDHLSNSENDGCFRSNTEPVSQTRSYFGLVSQDSVVVRTVDGERDTMQTILPDAVVPKISFVFIADSEKEIYVAQYARQKNSLCESDVPRTGVKKLAVCGHQNRYM